MLNLDIVELIRGLYELGGSYGYGGWFMGWLISLLFIGLFIHLVTGIFSDLFYNACAKTAEGGLEIVPNLYVAGGLKEKEFSAGIATVSRW